jgi:dCMP deaminase
MAKAPTPRQGVDEDLPLIDPSRFLPRIKQVQWDHYYMEVALTIRKRANCYGANVGAVLVRDNRIISTGFNGTPEGFPNCLDGGCVRCRDRELRDAGRIAEVSDPLFLDEGKHLDLCICVHAEANAIVSAARAGTRVDGSTLYATHKPCFTCLKEAIQAGVARVVYLQDYTPAPGESLRQQYELLAEHLRANDARNFEQLERQSSLVAGTAAATRPPVLDDQIELAQAASKPKPEKPAAKRASSRQGKP